MNIPSIRSLPLDEKLVLLRADFNVPFAADGNILDDSRIVETLPTIQHALEEGAKLVITSHLGRPKGKPVPSLSLEPVGARLAELLNMDVLFAHSCLGDGPKKLIGDLRPGQMVLLENTRFHPEEESNDRRFSEALAKNVDVYVNDAFGTLHRAHASTAGVAQYVTEKAMGLLVEKELSVLTKLRENPDPPFIVCLGGAKVSEKIGVIKGLLPLADGFLIGGAMAYTFLKAKGHAIGESFFEEKGLFIAEDLLKGFVHTGKTLLLPTDHICAESITSNKPVNCQSEIPDNLMGLDIGPETFQTYEREILRAKTVFWNGPMGVYEHELFRTGTDKIAKTIAYAGCTSIVGGGDSAAAVRRLGIADKLTHVSTGGGASLKFLEGSTLPGLEALKTPE